MSNGSSLNSFLIVWIFSWKNRENDLAASWGIMSGRESDLFSLFSSVLRRENIFFESVSASFNFAWKWEALACLMSFVTLFLACLYISVWTTRPVFRFFRSARLLACFALMTASFIQGELGRSGTTFSFSGACLFRRPRRVALYRSRRSSTPSGEPITRGDWAISARNSDLSMPLTFLHFTTLRGTRGLERSVSIVSKKWSDMYRLSTLTEVTSVLALHKTMSKMWPFTCVGSVTNWSKPSGLYNWTKRRVSRSLGLSMWKLKSPTTSTFLAGMLSSERNMPNSSMKSQVVSLFPADGGGRYTQPSRIVCLPLVMHTSVFSNKLKERCLHNRTLRCCRKMRATPPPLPDTRGLWRKENPGGVISPMLLKVQICIYSYAYLKLLQLYGFMYGFLTLSVPVQPCLN